MSKETEVIVKQFLMTVLKAKTLEEAQEMVKFLCTKEDIAEAEKIITGLNLK